MPNYAMQKYEHTPAKTPCSPPNRSFWAFPRGGGPEGTDPVLLTKAAAGALEGLIVDDVPYARAEGAWNGLEPAPSAWAGRAWSKNPPGN